MNNNQNKNKIIRSPHQLLDLRNKVERISDEVIEDGNTYPILVLCDQLVDAIDAYLGI